MVMHMLLKERISEGIFERLAAPTSPYVMDFFGVSMSSFSCRLIHWENANYMLMKALRRYCTMREGRMKKTPTVLV